MKVIFMGTPDFSVPALESIIKGHEVTAVITQPDKAKGRSGKLQYTPVKEAAIAHNIPVYQPQRIKSPEFIKELKTISADVIVVIAFGQILPKEILDMPRYGCINIHASLLPKYRGAAPIQWAIIDGETQTGVTTMYMDTGLDTGDIIEKTVIPINADETGGSLHDKLSLAGGELILSTLKKMEEGTAIRQKQNDEESCYAKMLDKALGKIDFSKSAIEIERLIRGLNPWPSAYTYLNGKSLKIWNAQVIEDNAEGTPGEIVEITNDSIMVMTGQGILAIKELQLEGKKRMMADAFLRGYHISVKEMLGC
ncbi:MAG: methionyl-tRNA formyltransferase [Eubacterium sp.]